MKQNTLLYIIIALLVAFLGYNYMQQNKQSTDDTGQTTPKLVENKSQDTTKQVQLALRKVGYKVPTDGVLEERTIGSIKDFEEKNGLIITGKADSVMLEELKLAYLKLDEQAWQAALDTNTQEAYQNYQEQFTDGKHIKPMANTLKKLQKK